MDHVAVLRDGWERTLPLDQDRVTVGRAADNSLVLPDPAVSGRHAALERNGAGWCVRDLGSGSGTYVNGTRVGGQPQPLRSGDQIAIGDAVLTLRAEEVSAGYLDVDEEWARPKPVAAPAPPTKRRPAPPERRQDHGTATVRGIVRGVSSRTTEQTSVLSFRVEQFDASGNRMAPVPVELHYHSSGSVTEGEEVQVTGSWHHGTLRADRIDNLSTGARVLGLSNGWKAVRAVIIGFIFAAFLVGIVAFLSIVVFAHHFFG